MKKRYSVMKITRLLVCLVLALGLLAGVLALEFGKEEPIKEPADTATTESSAETTTEEKEEIPTEPPAPHVVSTASIGVTGDILIHEPVYKAARLADGTYDFTENYEHIAPYFQKYDCMVANLEVTLGGGKPSSYPCFSCPDSVVDALKGAGVDLLLTANNHSYDTRTAGLVRTVQVVREKGLENLGTRENAEESFYKLRQVGDVKVGMACFTYSSVSNSGVKSLNGIPLDRNAFDLVCSFDANRLEEFYAEAERAVTELNNAGADVLMFYLHWGYEYRYTPSDHQKKMAAKLCELGVDVIVGGHPHVVQPFETITAENGNESLCIYSTGNAISNQRKALMNSDNHSGHTEDGMIFGVTYEKWSDGSVRLKEVEILPTWVIRESRGGKLVYQIIPLDTAVSDWKTFGLNDATLKEAKASYNRTLELVGAGLNAARTKLSLAEMPLTVN
ncbi:MAG: CapA family protein [Clostridia bacterium]|nr:CapA family protein [Clostridia bacterium]